jgi:hypothetical protein
MSHVAHPTTITAIFIAAAAAIVVTLVLLLSAGGDSSGSSQAAPSSSAPAQGSGGVRMGRYPAVQLQLRRQTAQP